MAAITTFRYVVTGRVQGVGFREAARRVATGLGIAGWVRNRRDGTVELFARGDAAALAALRQWLAHGPPHAHVTDVTYTEAADDEVAGTFMIRPTE